MAFTEEMFQEIMDDDVMVDKDKLMTGAYYGVPASIRKRVWMYMLNISDSSHLNEGKRQEERIRYYKNLRPTTYPQVKNAVNTVMHRVSLTDSKITIGLSNILCNYFSSNTFLHFAPQIVNFALPLYIASEHDEVSAFFMLTNLLDRVHHPILLGNHVRQAAKIARYISIFMPELFNHFNNEALDPSEVFVHWFQYLHSTALPLQSVIRLWDTYLSLSADELQKMLLFVSLALVDRFMPKIIRMEHVEIKCFLSNLPAVDVDTLMIQAETMRHQFASIYQSEHPSSHQSE